MTAGRRVTLVTARSEATHPARRDLPHFQTAGIDLTAVRVLTVGATNGAAPPDPRRLMAAATATGCLSAAPVSGGDTVVPTREQVLLNRLILCCRLCTDDGLYLMFLGQGYPASFVPKPMPGNDALEDCCGISSACFRQCLKTVTNEMD